MKYKGDQLLGFAYFLGSYERVKNCQDLTVRGEPFPQLYPPLQWIKSEMVNRCDPRHGRIAGADKPRRPANACPDRQRGPYSRLALRRQLGRPNALPLLVPFARALAMPAAISLLEALSSLRFSYQ